MIYLIDSDDATATGLKRILVAEGFDVAVVHDAKEFVHAAPAQDGDVVVFDSDTAELDPSTLLNGLHAKGLHTPVIVLSSGAKLKDRHSPLASARVAGAVGFFSKPVDGHALVDAIRFANS